MKTFTVEGRCWRKDVEVDDSVITDYADMCFEAMTQGVESFLNGDYEEEYDEEPTLGLFMVSYEKGYDMDDEKKSMALTEYVLFNAGHYALGEEFRRFSLETESDKQKKRRKKP